MKNNTSVKKCTKCKIEKDIEEFCWQNKSKEYRCSSCKECVKLYYENNRESITEYQKQYHENNKKTAAEYYRQYYKNNKKTIRERQKLYYKNNKKAVVERQKQYCKNNRSVINKHTRDRRHIDIIFKLKSYISAHISRALKYSKSGRHWEDLVGYTVIDLKLHLEKQFEPNMSWENYGEWHIDHRRPISWFDNAEENILKAWELSNLQPMWAHENLIKGNRWESPIKVKTAI